MRPICRNVVHCTTAIVVLTALHTGSARAGYKIIDLGTLGGNSASTTGINSSNQVIGRSTVSDANGGGFHGYIYDATTQVMTDLGAKIDPSGINASGVVVGSDPRSGHIDSYSVQGSNPPTPITLNSPYLVVSAAGINNSGVIAGQAYDLSDPTGPVGKAYTLNGSTQTILPTLGGANSYATNINNLGQVVGGSAVTDDPKADLRGATHAFVTNANGTQAYDVGATFALGVDSVGIAVNDNGAVLGRSIADNGSQIHAFIYQPGVNGDYQNGTLTNISLGSQYNSFGNGLNDNGDVVGSTYFAGSTVGADPNSSGITHGFIYTNGQIYDLNSLIDPTQNMNMVIVSASGINDAGYISADALDGEGQQHAVLLKPGVPPFLNPVMAGQFNVVPLINYSVPNRRASR